MVAILVKDEFPVYLASPNIGRGRIVSQLENSSKKAEYDATHDTGSTDAMRLGSGGHCVVLEPDRFTRDYTWFPGKRTAGADGPNGKWAEFLSLHDYPQDNILRSAEYEYCIELKGVLRKHRGFQALVEGTQKEISCYWDDQKARLDAYRTGLVIDLKTAYDITDRGIRKALGLSNIIQIPHYITGAAAYEGKPIDWATIEDPEAIPSFVFVFVSKSMPIEVRLVEVPFEHVKRAAMMRHLAIEQIRHDRDTNSYATYPQGIETFSPFPSVFPYEETK